MPIKKLSLAAIFITLALILLWAFHIAPLPPATVLNLNPKETAYLLWPIFAGAIAICSIIVYESVHYVARGEGSNLKPKGVFK